MGIFRGCGREGLHQGDKGGVPAGRQTTAQGWEGMPPRGVGDTEHYLTSGQERKPEAVLEREHTIELPPEEDEPHGPCQRGDGERTRAAGQRGEQGQSCDSPWHHPWIDVEQLLVQELSPQSEPSPAGLSVCKPSFQARKHSSCSPLWSWHLGCEGPRVGTQEGLKKCG